jgi:hypothetical protein
MPPPRSNAKPVISLSTYSYNPLDLNKAMRSIENPFEQVAWSNLLQVKMERHLPNHNNSNSESAFAL